MKKFIIQALVLIIVIFAALAFYSGKIPNVPTGPLGPSQTNSVSINNVKLSVEIADTADKRKRGLSGRESLASNSGMLFIFENKGKYGFWMKGMKFSLDLIFLRDKKVVDIIKNATPPAPNQKDEDLPIYMPREEIDMVLEVNSGFVDSHGIKVGDMMDVR